MQPMHVGFIPLGRPSFDMESANLVFEQSKLMLGTVAERISAPPSLLLSPEDTVSFLRQTIASGAPDMWIVQTTTFVDARFIGEIMDETDLPILMWGVREPRVNGTRLSLNSMTGLNGACNMLVSRRRKFQFVFGNPTEASLVAEMNSQLKVIRLVSQLKKMKIGVLGKHPDGFFFCDADPDMVAAIGPQIVELDLQEAFRRAKDVSDREIEETLDGVRGKVKQLDRIPQDGVRKFAAFQTALLQELKRQEIGMVGVRCLPEFVTDFGAAACSTVSALIDSGIMASCESDIHGALTMFIQYQLAQSSPYLGDLVHIDETKNSGVFWHCGAGSLSLARKDTGASAGIHPNRKLGFTLEFGLKPGPVTINRLGPNPFRPGSYRMLALDGEALDEPQKFWGTSVEVGFSRPIAPLFKKLMKMGVEPHYSLVYDRINEEIGMLCEWLDIDLAEG